MCERIPQDNKLNPERVEDIVKAAIAYADEIPERAYHVKSKWPFLYVISLLVCGVGTLWNYTTAQHGMEALITFVILSAVFGAYFCLFVRIRLPRFYGKTLIVVYKDKLIVNQLKKLIETIVALRTQSGQEVIGEVMAVSYMKF